MASHRLAARTLRMVGRHVAWWVSHLRVMLIVLRPRPSVCRAALADPADVDTKARVRIPTTKRDS